MMSDAAAARPALLAADAAEAALRGFLLYSYEVAESLLTRQGNAAQKQVRSAFVERLVMQPLSVS